MSLNFRNLLVDVCGRTVTVHPSDKKKLKAFFNSMDISYGYPPIGHPFQNATVQLFSHEDLNLLLLVTYGEMIDSSALCRRPSPQYIRSGGSSGGNCPTCPRTSSSSSPYTNAQISKWKQDSELYEQFLQRESAKTPHSDDEISKWKQDSKEYEQERNRINALEKKISRLISNP